MRSKEGVRELNLADLYKAYRKAKAEAFYDRGHFHSIAFAAYEGDLENNLRKLLRRLRTDYSWSESKRFLGRFSYLPKNIDAPSPQSEREIHFATLDPVEDWTRAHNGRGALSANFRPIIIASVDYQVVCALWIMRVGFKFDDKIDRKFAYAHALKRVGRHGRINEDAHQLYAPYFSGYRAWRSRGLEAMRAAMESGTPIVAVTMDIKAFYHSVSPEFLVRKGFLNRLGIELDAGEMAFTRAIVASMQTWHSASPESAKRPQGSLPVGLSASRLISNVLLADFDRVVGQNDQVIHYGRYADDIILVMRSPDVRSGEDFIVWLRKHFGEHLVLCKESGATGLRLKLSYAADSDIVFSAKKQKIFFLSGDHGLDLVGQIEEQIKKQSSEYRLLPELPESEAEMLDSALLATPDARLEADALRKAEAVSLRRLGFAMLLGDFESYAHDLDYRDADWINVRRKFYGIVERYLITPNGFFDYFSYITRVFGLMVACRDFKEAKSLLKRLDRISGVLQETTTAGREGAFEFMHARRSYFRGFLQVALESATVSNFEFSSSFTTLVRGLAAEARFEVENGRHVAKLARQFLLADLGRRSYQEYWYFENQEEPDQPRLPASVSVKRALVHVREYRRKAKKTLNYPYWPAIAFPTRPPSLWQLSLSVPKALEEPGELEKLLWAVRGGHVKSEYKDLLFLEKDEIGGRVWRVPSDTELRVEVAIPSVEVADKQWSAAIKGVPDHSLARYLAVRRIINQMMKASSGLNYVVFPELSLPYWWALDIASRLARTGISLIAGVETRGSGEEYRNDVLVSLTTDFYGRRGNICFLQPKIDLSHEEAAIVAGYGKKFLRDADPEVRRPVYCHGKFSLGVLICSDLTTIQNRSRFQGAIDALFVVEWNKDVETFDFLVESAAHDLHAAIVQVNNRRFGDSRVRMPFAEAFKRDVVKVKGGEQDFFVHCSIDARKLRKFQLREKKAAMDVVAKKENVASKKQFKPTPIGFRVLKHRRNASR